MFWGGVSPGRPTEGVYSTPVVKMRNNIRYYGVLGGKTQRRPSPEGGSEGLTVYIIYVPHASALKCIRSLPAAPFRELRPRQTPGSPLGRSRHLYTIMYIKRIIVAGGGVRMPLPR